MSRISILLLLIYLFLPPIVPAQCGQRDLGGTWSVLLSAFKTEVRLTLKQAGNEISGTADGSAQTNFGFESRAEVTGNIKGDKVIFSIQRENSTKLGGISISESFEGNFKEDGTISGRANIYSLEGPVSIDWVSSRPMKCLFKPVSRLGVKHSDSTAPTAPYIAAAPNNIVLPFGQAAGVTNLIWDAGNDHPYAEVWVKIDGQDETKVLEKGKGTLPVSIAAERTYVYILTDAGTTLATVTVRFGR